jgi:hypothetical protein
VIKTGAPAYFAGAGVGKLRQKLRQTKLRKIISYFNKHLVLRLDFFYLLVYGFDLKKTGR